MTQSKVKGFTLVELMIIVALLAILAAIILPIMNNVSLKGKRAVAIGNLKEIVRLQEAYYQKNRVYLPCSSAPFDGVGYASFEVLGFELKEPQQYRYEVIVSDFGKSFRATATGDPDGDGQDSVWEATNKDPAPRWVNGTDSF